MGTRERNVQYFTAKYNDNDGNVREVEFRCSTTDTRSGFCHRVKCLTHDMTLTRVSYYNRTWERFTYETALERAIEKLPKEVQDTAYAQIIDKKAFEVKKKADAFLKSFEKLYDGLNDDNKKHLAESGIEIHTEQDAKVVMGLMGLMSLMQK